MSLPTGAGKTRVAVEAAVKYVLAADDFEPWLRGAAGVELLKPAPNDLLQKWPVSRRVSSSKADKEDATLIEPIGEEAKTLLW